MASPTDKTAAELRDALEAQITEIRKEIASLSKVLANKSANLANNAENSAAEFYDVMKERGTQAADKISQQARIAKETVRENPLATLAVIAGISLLIGLIARK